MASGTRQLRPQDPRVNRLARRWRGQHDRRAREELFDQYLSLAHRLAARYRNACEPTEDLRQVAAEGLLRAIDRYDPERGIAFAAFAVPTILGELKRHFRNTGWSVHVPRGAQELAWRVDRAAQEVGGRIGRSPTAIEVAEYMEIDLEDVLVGLHAAAAHYSISLDAPAPGSDADEPQTLGDGVPQGEDGYELIESKLSLGVAMRCLPHRERVALHMRIHEDLKQSEIAIRMGCSQMQVSRLLSRAAARIRMLTNPDLTPATESPAVRSANDRSARARR